MSTATVHSNVIVFYDIYDVYKAPRSPNTWKARYTLNFKRIPYKTEWVEIPDVEALCLKIGAPPTSRKPDGRPLYTLPVIYDPSTKRVISESATIAKYLDTTYPETPVLFPSGTDALQAVFLDTVQTIVMRPLQMISLPRTCSLWSPRTAAHVRMALKEAGLEKPVEELGGEEHWVALEAGLEKLNAWLSANGPGRDELFLGDKVCFCDLQVAALLIWARDTCGEDWERIAGWHGGKWKRIVESFDQYAARG